LVSVGFVVAKAFDGRVNDALRVQALILEVELVPEHRRAGLAVGVVLNFVHARLSACRP
jgi:hypothetical protein